MKIAFIGSECYLFVKTGGLGDVMYALPRALVREGCEARVILPLYNCIPDKFKQKMIYQGSFMMDLTSDGRTFYVGIMETVMDGVTYDFITKNQKHLSLNWKRISMSGPLRFSSRLLSGRASTRFRGT